MSETEIIQTVKKHGVCDISKIDERQYYIDAVEPNNVLVSEVFEENEDGTTTPKNPRQENFASIKDALHGFKVGGHSLIEHGISVTPVPPVPPYTQV